MNRKFTILMYGLLFVSLSTTLRSEAQGGGEQKTIWSGVYSDEQATKGQAVYEQYCVNCHGSALGGSPSSGGPPLAGDKFMENWREDTVENLFLKIRNTMPRRGFQGSEKSLSDAEALNAVAFIFKKNSFPAGPDLNIAGLGSVRIEHKDGPKPLPNYSQVQVVGCMQQEAENWVLLQAPQPTRLRGSGETLDPDVLKAAERKPLGNLKLRLQNLMMLGAFTPEAYKGHKMLAQGALIHQGGIDRISVTQLQTVSANCGQ